MRTLLFSALVSLSCVKTLPPPTTPIKEFPPLNGTPAKLTMGTGRVYLNVVEGPASVTLKPSTISLRSPEALCVTPCFVDLPYGSQTLELTLKANRFYTESTTVTVAEAPSAENHALALKPQITPQKIALLTGASLAAIVGGSYLLLAASAARTGDFKDRNTFLVVAGIFIPTAVVLNRVAAKKPVERRVGAVTRWPIQETPSLAEYHQRDPDKEKAALIFEDAKAHYNAQDYLAAVKLFQDAYVISKEPALLINIGQCYRQMNKNEEAAKSLKAFLREAPDSELRPEIERLLLELQ